MVSPADAAKRIGVGRTTLYGLMSGGEVKAVKIGRRTLIPISELERFVERLRAGAAA